MEIDVSSQDIRLTFYDNSVDHDRDLVSMSTCTCARTVDRLRMREIHNVMVRS